VRGLRSGTRQNCRADPELQRRHYGGKRILWLALSLCERCLLDAGRSGAVSNLDGLRDSLRGLRALGGDKRPVSGVA
jgi:hypothetical protein